MNVIFKTLSLFSIAAINISQAQVVMPDDVPYFVHETDSYNFIYPEEYRSLIPKVVADQNRIEALYEKSFSWKLDEKTSLVLASNNNQIANAFATVYYNNLNFYYNGGASVYDSFAIRSWLYTLLAHEGAHLYQLDPKKGLAESYHRYLGNSVVPHFLFFIPVFVTPNILLPTWLLEGNSVLNESRLGNGGRLYSGEERALFYALVRSGKLDEARLTNNHLDFPYGHEKYNVGAEFALYLAERFGMDKANSFFSEHANHWVNPFILNYSFERHFNRTYSELVDDFLVASGNKARLQKAAVAPRLVEEPFIGPMNSNSQKIYFMSGDGKNSNLLNIYDKKSRFLERRKLDIPVNKVFELSDGRFVSVSSGTVNSKQYLFSLWDEKSIDVEAYRGKIILDKRGEDVLWFDPLTSMDEPQLFLNNKNLGKAHSSALFDKDGHVYYFKQEANKRTLYKDTTALVSFPSYYAKLTEIDEEGRPYFVASTEYGSSLFTLRDGKVFRLFDSDVIFDARKITEGDFLVREVEADGYEIKLLRASPREEKPVLYSYFFEKEAPFQYAQKEQENNSQTTSSISQREYSLTHDLQFGGMGTAIMLANDSLYFSLNGIWSDPLDYNNILLSYNRDSYRGEDIYRLAYLNKKNVVQWYLDYSREQYYLGNDLLDNTKKDNHDDRPEAGFIWPFYKRGFWTFSVEEAVSYRSLRDTAVNYASLSFEREKHHALEFLPYSKWALKVEDDRGGDQLQSSAVSFDIYHTLPYNVFAHAFGVYKESNEDELKMENAIRSSGQAILTKGYSLTGPEGKNKKGGRLSFEIGPFFESGIYYASFPISLRRLAPKFIFSHYYFNQYKYRDFQERGTALDADLLVVHMLPVRLTVAALRRERDKADLVIGIGSQGGF